MNYLMITKNERDSRIEIRAELDGERLPMWTYFWFSEREAIKRYRQQFNLVGKHLTKIYI